MERKHEIELKVTGTKDEIIVRLQTLIKVLESTKKFEGGDPSLSGTLESDDMQCTIKNV